MTYSRKTLLPSLCSNMTQEAREAMQVVLAMEIRLPYFAYAADKLECLKDVEEAVLLDVTKHLLRATEGLSTRFPTTFYTGAGEVGIGAALGTARRLLMHARDHVEPVDAVTFNASVVASFKRDVIGTTAQRAGLVGQRV